MGLNSKFLISSVTRDGGTSSMDIHADENGKNENENLTSWQAYFLVTKV